MYGRQEDKRPDAVKHRALVVAIAIAISVLVRRAVLLQVLLLQVLPRAPGCRQNRCLMR